MCGDAIRPMSDSTLRLFLARHGETAGNREMRYLGVRDEPLSPSGVEQAGRLAAALASLPLAAVYASPLQRTAATAHRIAAAVSGRELAVRFDPRLREQDFGAWEGLTRAEVLAGEGREALLAWESDFSTTPPGGESLSAVQERALGLVADLAAAHGGEQIVLVSHVGPIKALLCAALGAPLATARRFFLDPATLSVVDWGERPVIRLVNAHGHLGWESARWMH